MGSILSIGQTRQEEKVPIPTANVQVIEQKCSFPDNTVQRLAISKKKKLEKL